MHFVSNGHLPTDDLRHGYDQGVDLSSSDRQALHAWRLTLTHPATGEPMTFEAPLPADLRELLERLRAG